MADQKSNVWRKDYDSIQDVLSVKASETNETLLTKTLRENGRGGWYGPGCNTAQDAFKLYDKGWAEGAEKIAAIKSEALAAPRSVKRRRVWADQGDDIDIHRVYAGRLDQSWRKSRREKRMGVRTVTIICPINVACMYKSEQLFWRGAAVGKLSDLLSEAGYNVAIVGVIATTSIDSYHGDDDMVHSVELKAPDQPLDLGNIAAALAHSGFFRSVGFTLIASFPERIGGHFGTNPIDEVNKLVKDFADEFHQRGETTVVAPYDMFDESSSKRWLDAAVARFNGDGVEDRD